MHLGHNTKACSLKVVRSRISDGNTLGPQASVSVLELELLPDDF